MEKTTKVNLASGRMYLHGYLNVDDLSMNPKSKVDLESDIFTLNLKKESLTEILLSHFMMYVLPKEAEKLFKKWYGWLKVKGELIIETSDAQSIADMILSDPTKVEQMFGYGDTAGHRWSWTPQTIRPLLKKAGFRRMVVSRGGLHNRPDRDFTIIATK